VAVAAGDEPRKRRKVGVVLTDALRAAWRRFAADLSAAERAAAAAEGGFAFAFVEGALVSALREGWWLLLDEINLAPPEVLERIAGVLETSSSASAATSESSNGADGEAEASGLLLVERGDAAAVPRHPGFRLVAAMNPATDAGKHDLPPRLRGRFTELWVSEPRQRADQAALVAGYLAGAAPNPPVDAVVDFYRAAKAEAVGGLGGGGRITLNCEGVLRGRGAKAGFECR
jgi:midasin